MVKLINAGELADALEREERLRQALEWALGARGEFRLRKKGEWQFWWRKELMKRAGLAWDGGKFIDVVPK